jgi:hypothetical protein
MQGTYLVRFVLLAIAAMNGCRGTSSVISTFDTDAEGWTIYGDAQGSSVDPTYEEEEGNPEGAVFANDNATGGVWYWQTPPKFLGDQSAAYGNFLTFDLKQSSTTDQFDSPDVVLVSDDITLTYDTERNPSTDWTHYRVALRADGGWKQGDLQGLDATESDIRDVLGDLTALRIRGEFRTGADTGGLDNVVLNR